MADAWLIGALVVATAVHLLLFVVTLRVRRAAEESSDEAAADDTTGLTCPDCGADNEPEFRFCRECVTELPGNGPAGAGGGAAAGRRTL